MERGGCVFQTVIERRSDLARGSVQHTVLTFRPSHIKGLTANDLFQGFENAFLFDMAYRLTLAQ